jgi:hypothetical protein
LLFCWKWICV